MSVTLIVSIVSVVLLQPVKKNKTKAKKAVFSRRDVKN
jgi:hypothetical protein